jgi:selenide,water dikinase
MMDSVPIVKELLLIGGGHTHALVLRRWGMRPVPGVRVTLVSPEATAPYTGMLPGHIAGHYPREALDIDLVRLARFAGARFIPGHVVGLDPGAGIATLAAGRRVSYDLASLDIGITADMDTLPGFAAHGIPAKPLGRFATHWAEVAAGSGPVRIAVLGGGVAGAEIAMACAHRLTAEGRAFSISLIDRGRVLGSVPSAARAHLVAALEGWGIELIAQDAPAEVLADAVLLDSGRRVAADLIIGAAGAVPQGWLEGAGLDLHEGFVLVDRTLRSTSHATIYAAGDCAHFAPDPRPKAGVYAVRAAPVLAHNLAADLTGRQRRAFRPQRDFLKLISLGGKTAVAEKAGIALAGPALWRWKDRIDARFMEKLRDLPAMSVPKAPAHAATGVAAAMAGPAPCGGCGAKLGSGALSAVIAGLGGAARADTERLAGDDAAIIRLGGARQVISTDHLRAFAPDPALVARVAAVHALGDVWAMGAAPQSAVATVILPRLEPRLQGAWLEEVMGAAHAVFAAVGASVLGGHSSMGAELTVGFTVTGLLDRDPVTLSGGHAGDALILTKPLGTGVILAGEMQGKAKGVDVLACWDAMSVPQDRAAVVLSPVARAMTDVTGFGLAGHLWNICAASGTGAALTLDAVPILPGAEALAARGVRSTLYLQNRAALEPVIAAADGTRTELLFDPQTAGGLLAAVDADAAEAVLEQLAEAGVAATRIGSLTDRTGRIDIA